MRDFILKRMLLYKHQQDILNDDPTRTGLWLGTGSGKTLLALCLARGKTLVMCPKTQKEDRNWERENDKNKLGVDLTTISKETFRRDWDKLPKFDTFIIDECHTALGATPNIRFRKKVAIPKTSQIFESVENYLQKHKPSRLYLCTATIVRSPMTVWAAAKLLGYDWNFYEFRSTFYIRLPMPGREVWTPKNDSATKDRLAKAVRKIGYVGRLEDYFDVPDQNFKTIYVDLLLPQQTRMKTISLEYPDPLVLIGKKNQIENGVLTGDEFNASEHFNTEKIEKILDLALEFPKMVIFAKYRAQIQDIETALVKAKYKVLTLTGDTKNRGDVIAEANRLDKCIFVAQAQVSSGWELPDYPTMVFASRTYSFTDYQQALGRIQRANNIKKNLYINLIVRGGIDEMIDRCLQNKVEFDERIYLKL